MGYILFDDGRGKLGPLCDLRASFEVRSGAVTTHERLTAQLGAEPTGMWVPAGLAALVRARHTVPVNELAGVKDAAGGPGGGVLLINGRWTRVNAELPNRLNTVLVDEHGDVVAARLTWDRVEAFLERLDEKGDAGTFDNGLDKRVVGHANLLRRPWELLQRAEENLEHDLGQMGHLKPLNGSLLGVTVVGRNGVLVSPRATVHPHVVFDTSAGPIAIDDGAEVRSMSVVVGPGYVGPNSIVTNHGHIRAGTIIGPMCKVGGEVNGCVFHGHANKAHSGYLGNSYVGEWVNLGADTITSNLKNTYSPVQMQIEVGDAAEATGMTHLGSIIGDHVKTAIGTRLVTGSCLNTGAMLAVSMFPPKCVDRFAFLTDKGEQRYDLDKFIEVAEAVMQRRGQQVTGELMSRLEGLHG
ncbi:MAG: putative sugar nucleotidyl transferase [Phycisphaeraceae bacterium]